MHKALGEEVTVSLSAVRVCSLIHPSGVLPSLSLALEHQLERQQFLQSLQVTVSPGRPDSCLTYSGTIHMEMLVFVFCIVLADHPVDALF